VSEACTRCPCPETCLGWPAFCEWAAEDPPDEVKIHHIRARSAMPARIAPSPAPAHDPDRPEVREALALARAMRACAFRSTGSGCGCAGGRCSLRRGSFVSHLDCFDCLRRYPAH